MRVTLCLLIAVCGCSINNGQKDIGENRGWDSNGDSSTEPGTTVTVGTGTTGCTDVGDPNATRYWVNDIAPESMMIGGVLNCTWIAELDAAHDLILTKVYAYGYNGATSGPSSGAVFNRSGGDAPTKYFIPSHSFFNPSDLETSCFDVTAGGSGNADFRWVASDDVKIDADSTQHCLEDCKGGGGCADPDISDVSCTGTYEFQDTAAPVSCALMGPVGIDFQGAVVGAGEKQSAAADGASGSGDFMLLPTSIADNDGDGHFHVRLLPIMLSGSGTLTANAVINSITSVTIPSGGDLRLLNDDLRSINWTPSDSLVNAGSVSSAITGSVTFSAPKPKAPGIFAATGIPASSLDDYRVSMSWTTVTNSGPTRPQGWALKLQDIGCSSYKQKFTLRRLTSPERVVVAPYGLPSEGETFPATHASGTTSFNISYADFHIVGQLQSMSSQGATLVLSTLTYQGSNVCSTGTYSMAPE